MHDLRGYGGGGGSISPLDGSGADPELLASVLLDELPLPESEPLEDVALLLTGSADDDSSTTLLEGGSMPDPLDEELPLPTLLLLEPDELEPLPEISLLLSSTSLELGSTTLELGSTTLDDGSALDEPLEDSNELDDPELLPEDEPLLDPLDELEQ